LATRLLKVGRQTTFRHELNGFQWPSVRVRVRMGPGLPRKHFPLQM